MLKLQKKSSRMLLLLYCLTFLCSAQTMQTYFPESFKSKNVTFQLVFSLNTESNEASIYVLGSNLMDYLSCVIDLVYNGVGSDIGEGSILLGITGAQLSSHFVGDDHIYITINRSELIDYTRTIKFVTINFPTSSNLSQLMSSIKLSKVTIKKSDSSVIEAQILDNSTGIIDHSLLNLNKPLPIKFINNVLIIENEKLESIKLNITNLKGRNILQKTLPSHIKAQYVKTTSFSSGIYIYKIQMGNRIFTNKFKAYD